MNNFKEYFTLKEAENKGFDIKTVVKNFYIRNPSTGVQKLMGTKNMMDNVYVHVSFFSNKRFDRELLSKRQVLNKIKKAQNQLNNR